MNSSVNALNEWLKRDRVPEINAKLVFLAIEEIKNNPHLSDEQKRPVLVLESVIKNGWQQCQQEENVTMARIHQLYDRGFKLLLAHFRDNLKQ